MTKAGADKREEEKQEEEQEICVYFRLRKRILRQFSACCGKTFQVAADFAKFQLTSYSSCVQPKISESIFETLWNFFGFIGYFIAGGTRMVCCIPCQEIYPLKDYVWKDFPSIVRFHIIKPEKIACEKLLVAHHVWNCHPTDSPKDLFRREFFMTELICYCKSAWMKIYKEKAHQQQGLICCSCCYGAIRIQIDELTERLCNEIMGSKWNDHLCADFFLHPSKTVRKIRLKRLCVL